MDERMIKNIITGIVGGLAVKNAFDILGLSATVKNIKDTVDLHNDGIVGNRLMVANNSRVYSAQIEALAKKLDMVDEIDAIGLKASDEYIKTWGLTRDEAQYIINNFKLAIFRQE